MFDIGKNSIVSTFFHRRKGENKIVQKRDGTFVEQKWKDVQRSTLMKSTFQCDLFLTYNDKTVDIEASNIECTVKGNATNFVAVRSVEANTGFKFRVQFRWSINSMTTLMAARPGTI